jgi:hypothetical protein
MLLNPNAAYNIYRGSLPPWSELNSWYLYMEPILTLTIASPRDSADRLFSRVFTNELSYLINHFKMTASELAICYQEWQKRTRTYASIYVALDAKGRLVDEDLCHPVKNTNVSSIFIVLNANCFVAHKDRKPQVEEIKRALFIHFHFPHGKVEEECTVSLDSIVASSLREDNRRELALLFLHESGLLVKGEDGRNGLNLDFNNIRFRDLTAIVGGNCISVDSKTFEDCQSSCTTITSVEEVIPDNRETAALNAQHVGLFCTHLGQLLSSYSLPQKQ